ncbi:hypothetical protein Tco_0065539 [Tanacetum coccineum]
MNQNGSHSPNDFPEPENNWANNTPQHRLKVPCGREQASKESMHIGSFHQMVLQRPENRKEEAEALQS